MYYEHASVPGVFYAQPVPPEVNYCWQGRAWQIKAIDRGDIKNAKKEAVVERLPKVLS